MHFKPFKMAAIGLALSAVATLASAQQWPAKPVHLIVPFAAGGPADIQARWIGNQLSARLKQPVIIENKGGAGGMLGARSVATAPADGYTLLFASVGAIAITPYLVTKPTFDPRELAPVVRVATAPGILVTKPGGAFKDFNDMVAKARAQPDRVSFASAGPGTTLHLAGEILARETQTKLVHVPYKGASPGVTDVMGGQVDLIFADAPVVLPFLKANKVTALAVGSTERLAALPDVPTAAELGYKGVQSSTWYGLFAPVKTPTAVVQRINEDVNALLASPEAKAFFAEQSMKIDGGSSSDFSNFIAADTRKWTTVAKEVGVRLD